MFCSERKSAPFVITIVVSTRISLSPPCYSEHCAGEVISDLKGHEPPERQTVEELRSKGFVRLALPP